VRVAGNGGAPFTSNGIELHAGRYHVVSADLRDAVELAAKLSACGVDRAQPTLFIAECVLIYLPPEAAHAIIAWAAGAFTHAAFVNYEQVRMWGSGRFGRTGSHIDTKALARCHARSGPEMRLGA
jgi:O-methyltransferase involved in polyketide biosynthesis